MESKVRDLGNETCSIRLPKDLKYRVDSKYIIERIYKKLYFLYLIPALMTLILLQKGQFHNL